MTEQEGHQQNRFSGGFGRKINSSSYSSVRLRKGQYQLQNQHVEPLPGKGLELKAEPILRLLAQAQSPCPEVFRDLGNIYERRNDPSEAERWYKRWLSSTPSQAHERLAQALKAEQFSWLDLALQRYLDVLELEPTQPEALRRASSLLLERTCFADAMPLLLNRLQQETHTDELLIQASWCSFEVGSVDDAVRLANMASPGHPDNPIILTIQAYECQHRGRIEKALELAQRALSRAVATSQWNLINRLLSRLFFQQGLLESSQACLEVAKKAEPFRAEIHRLLGEILLLQNRLHEGFIEYQWHPPTSSPSTTTVPKHRPSRNIALISGCTLGDTLLFSRYAIWLKEFKNMNVRLFVPHPLLALLRISLGDRVPVQMMQDLKHDLKQDEVVLPMLSAPAVYGTCQEFPELAHPHLRADNNLIEHWRQLLNIKTGERLIGINWCGSPLTAITEYHKSDIPLDAFAPFAALPKTRLLSLQKGFGTRQLLTCSFRDSFINQQQEISAEMRFEHTAAIMSLCDYMVSDDSGPAHLSGCLGVPTIVMLPPLCNWRWGASGENSPWYLRTVLLRRNVDQDWLELAVEASRIIQAH